MSETEEKAVYTTVPALAAAVAAEIRANGHFQGVRNGGNIGVQSCLLANNCSVESQGDVFSQYVTLLTHELGGKQVGDVSIAEWNDSHSTEEVLALLDKIAEGEQQ